MVSFTLRRNLVWISSAPTQDRFVMVDPEVVRVLDREGTELWGRRLSIGKLKSAAFCLGGIVVVGEEGSARLSLDGLSQKWPTETPPPSISVTATQNGACLFTTPTGERALRPTPDNKEGPSLVGASQTKTNANFTVENGVKRATVEAGLLSFWREARTYANWAKPARCAAPCPVALWGDFVAVGGQRLLLYSQADGSLQETQIGVSEEHFVALSATKDLVAFGLSDGTVEIWEGIPR